MTEVQNVLRVGDVVVLADLETGGFIAGDDVISSNLYVEEQVEFSASLSPHTVHSAAFVVVPRFQYAALRAIEEFVRKIHIPLQDMKNWSERIARLESWRENLSPDDSLYKELSHHIKAYQDEQATNELESRRTAGHLVSYGNVIQLRHCKSGKFLTQSKTRAKVNRLALDVSLSEEGNKGSWLRIIPTGRARSDGDYVRYGDQLQLGSVKFSNTFLSVSSDQEQRRISDMGSIGSAGSAGDGVGNFRSPAHLYDKVQPVSTFQYLEPIMRRLHPTSVAYHEVNASTDIHKFQVRLFRTWSSNNQKMLERNDKEEDCDQEIENVYGLDIVTFRRNRDDTVLYADPHRGVVTWTSSPDALNNHSEAHFVHEFAYWRLKPVALDKCGETLKVDSHSNVLIQHVVTGKYLSFSGSTLCLSDDFRSSSAAWLLASSSPTDGNNSLLSNGDGVWIKKSKTKDQPERWLGIKRREPKKLPSLDVMMSHLGKPASPDRSVDEHEASLDSKSFKPNSSKEVSLRSGQVLDDSDILELRLVEEEEIEVVDCSLGCVEFLHFFLGLLYNADPLPELESQQEQEQAIAMHGLRPAIAALLPYFEITVGHLLQICSSERKKVITVLARQDLLRHVGILQQLVDIVVAVFNRLHMKPDVIRKRFHSLHLICKMCYTVVEKACQGNAGNKAELQRNLPQLQVHLKEDLTAYALILNIYSDASELSAILNDDSIFEEKVDSLRSTKSARSVGLMARTCHSDGVPIPENQNRLVSVLLESASDVIFVMEEEDGSIFLRDSSDAKLSICVTKLTSRLGEDALLAAGNEDRKEHGSFNKEASLVCYHLQMLELLALLVQGRNEYAMKAVLALAPAKGLEFDTLLAIIKHAGVPYSLRTRCCNLLCVLYVDKDPHHSMNQMMRTRIWTGINGPGEQSEGRGREGGGQETFSELKRVLLLLLKDCVSVSNGAYTKNPSKDQFVTQLVSTLSTLMDFGFYHSYNPSRGDRTPDFAQLREVSPALLSVLDSRHERGSSTEGARFEVGPCNEIIAMRNVKILALFHTFLDCCLNSAITQIAIYWESILRESFGILSLDSALRVLFDSEEHAIAVEDSMEVSLLNGIRRFGSTKLSRSASASKSSGMQILDLSRYENDPMLWVREAPWSQQQVKDMAETIYNSNSVLADLNELREEEDGEALPKIVRILLDLVRYKNVALKTSAVEFLIRIYKQKTTFALHLETTNLITDRDLAMSYRKIRDLLADFHMHIKHLARTDEELKNERKNSFSLIAFQSCTKTVATWIEMLQKSDSRDNFFAIQNIMVDFHLHLLLIDILRIPFEKIAATNLGALDRMKNSRLRDLFNHIYSFLALLVSNNSKLQTSVLNCTGDIFLSHLGIQGLDVEDTMIEVVRDNQKNISRVGKEWCRVLLQDVILKFFHLKPSWLQLLSALVLCQHREVKDLQDNLRKIIQSNDHLQHFLMPKKSAWSLIAASEAKEEEERLSRPRLEWDAAFIQLLADLCEGKNPASKVFAERFVSFEWIVCLFVQMDARRSGEQQLRLALKKTLLNAFRKIYIKNDSDSSRGQEIHMLGCGIWSFDQELFSSSPDRTLMDVLADDISAFLDRMESCRSSAALDDPHLLHLYDYLKASLVPAIREYYILPSFLVPERSHSENMERGERLGDLLNRLLNLNLMDLSRIDRNGSSQEFVELVWETLSVMISNGKLQLMLPEVELLRQREGVLSDLSRLSRCLHHGFRAMRMAVSRELKSAEMGCELPLLLCRDAPAPLYEQEKLMKRKLPMRENPSFSSLLVDMIPILKAPGTEEQTLIDLLGILRAAIYVNDPCDPNRTADSCTSSWDAFIQHELAMHAGGERAQELSSLAWVQSKFDAIGCTAAALRLMAHGSSMVQVQATSLLLTLLQGGNRRVQETMSLALKSPKHASFFDAVSKVLQSTMNSLKEYKRKRKPKHGSRTQHSPSMQVSRLEQDLDASVWKSFEDEDDLIGIGRKSQVMLVLRLLQLMCFGQYQPLQEMMTRQSGSSVSCNLLKQCIDLFSALLPLVGDTTKNNDPTSFLILCLQLLETITDAVMGPNTKNQQEVMSSYFFFDINRIFSSIVYLPVRDSSQRTSDSWGSGESSTADCSINDYRCFLKLACLKCCLSFFDAVVDEEMPREMIGFFDVRNLISQMLANEKILGLDKQSRAAEFFNSLQAAKARREGKAKDMQDGLSVDGSEAPRRDLIYTMQFGKAFQDLLRSELMQFYQLLLYFAEYDNTGKVANLMSTIESEHSSLYKYLYNHTTSVEIVRSLSGEKKSDEQTSSTASSSHVEKVYFSVSERMIELVSSKDFKDIWHEMILSIPKDNSSEKMTLLLNNIHSTLAMATWVHHVGKSTWGHILLKYRESFRTACLRLSVLITALLIFFYGIPMDPNSRAIVGDGKFHPSSLGTLRRPPAGYRFIDYPWSLNTSDPEGWGKTYGFVLHSSDLSLKYRLALTSRWDSDAEWLFFPLLKNIMRVLAVFHVLLSILNLLAYIVLDFPLELWNQSKNGGQLGLETLQAPSTRARDILFSRIPISFDLDSKISRAHDQQAIDGGAASLRQRGKRYLENMPPPPELGDSKFGSPGKSFTWYRVAMRCWPGLYQTALVIISMLGLLSSPLYYVASMMDYLRMSGGRVVLKSLYVGAPNLMRSFTVGVLFLIASGVCTYAYFSQTAIIEDESCHSPFQCVSKHIYDSFRGDITTVLGQFSMWTYPPLVIWEDLWYQWRTIYVLAGLVFWNMLLQPVMQGQIFDAFAEIRSKATAATLELESKCFITGLERHRFSKYPGEWEPRRGGKYAIRYLLYLKHLLDKDPADYNGTERSVIGSIVANNTGFFPVGVFVAEQRRQNMEKQNSENSAQEATNEALENFMSEVRKEIATLRDRNEETTRALLNIHGRLESMSRRQ